MNKNLIAFLGILISVAGCGSGTNSPTASYTSTRSLAEAVSQASDTATIAAYRANFTITKNTDGTTTLANLIDKTTQSFPSTVQTIRFADNVVSFDAAGVPGQSYRLYQAAFNRQPDQGGLGFWTHAMQGGATLDAVAAAFVGSPEFQSRYGQVGDAEFIALLYNNVLQRTADQAGQTYWAQQMKNGMSRQGVLANFSESQENKDRLAPALRNGMDYIPDASERKVIPVQKSSYQNRIAAATSVGSQRLPREVMGGNAVAFADFFQDGSYSMVTHSLEYNPSDPATAGKYGHIHFYKKEDGSWIDHTAQLLPDTSGCLHPRKAVVADFNGDGKPDVYFACHGFDAPPFSGEQPHMLLSQSDGSYKNTTLPITCFCHAASAAEFNTAGYADILVTDTSVAFTPFFLMNNRDGTFSVDKTRLPSSLVNKAIFTAEMIDFGRGIVDIFFGGNENAEWTPSNVRQMILPNDGKGRFISTVPVELPGDSVYGFPLDIAFVNNQIYLLRTVDNPANSLGFYGGVSIQKIAYPSLQAQTIYQHNGSYASVTPGFNSRWVNWIIPYQGNILSLEAGYGVSVPQ